MPLQPFVNSASKIEVITGMQKIKTDFLPSFSLLDNLNPLGINAVGAINDHFKPLPPSQFSFDDAKTYLAAASFVHCNDGWQYLSNAVDSLFRGDFKTAVHLAYYAELRSGMSFLASEGIGIFNSVHFCIGSTPNIFRDPKSNFQASASGGFFRGWGTHRFIWECLDSFTNSPHKDVSHLLEVFWHNGLSFAEWIMKIPHANTLAVLSQIIKLWLRDWAFDISHFKDDREGRNSSSYGPSKFKDFNVDDCTNSIDFYSESLRLLEPQSNNRFSLLDKHLFKMLFLKIHTEITNQGIAISINDLLDETFVAAGKPMDNALKSIILAAADHPFITASHNTVIDAAGNVNPFAIYARALLLLRTSTGSVSYLLKQAGITDVELKFFLDFCCVEHGLWKPGNTVTDLDELWVDLYDAMTDIDSWRSGQASPVDLRSFYDAQSSNLTIYKQINRANYWGMAI